MQQSTYYVLLFTKTETAPKYYPRSIQGQANNSESGNAFVVATLPENKMARVMGKDKKFRYLYPQQPPNQIYDILMDGFMDSGMHNCCFFLQVVHQFRSNFAYIEISRAMFLDIGSHVGSSMASAVTRGYSWCGVEPVKNFRVASETYVPQLLQDTARKYKYYDAYFIRMIPLSPFPQTTS